MSRLRLAAILVSSLTFAQSIADDPGGWTKAKWGMTRDQVKAAFPQSTEVEDLGETHLGLARYVIDHKIFSAAFYFDKDNALYSVHLIDQKILVTVDGSEICETCPSAATQPTQSSRSSRKKAAAAAATDAVVKAELNAFIVAETKDRLLDALTEKYGKPTADTRSDIGENFDWLFPSTRLTLSWLHSDDSKERDKVSLFYARRSKSSDL